MAFLAFDDDASTWLHERIDVAEPFATAFRIKHVQRYDLLAHIANALQLPGRDYDPSTERFVASIYDSIHLTWKMAVPKPGLVIREALWHLDRDQILSMLEDFGWDDAIEVTATPKRYETELANAIVNRLEPKVDKLLRKLERAQAVA